jgi:uncharacterized protein (TIGR03435 family)
MMRSGLLMGLALIVIAIPLLSQTPAPARPSFEVVSIKPSAPANSGIRLVVPQGDRYRMVGVRLRLLLTQAYGKLENGLPFGKLEIVGAPSWIDVDRYDIEATTNCSRGSPPLEQIQLMIRSMLEDRFQLKAHIETRELPIYNLIVARDRPKLKRSEDQTQAEVAPLQACSPATPLPGLRGNPGGVQQQRRLSVIPNPDETSTVLGVGMPIANLAEALPAGRPVIDKTDIKGLYDFKFTFIKEGLQGATGPADPVPSLFSAIQELGLRLESAKGPVDVLVIDSVQKPTAN